MIARGHGILAAAAVLVTAAACGCASGPTPVLDFPDSRLSKSMTHQGVRFVLEDEADDYSVKPVVRPKGDGIEFDFGQGRSVLYRFKNFIAGGGRFPAADADLFLFRERRGDWSFRYRGQRVRVESEGPWNPALYFRVVETTDRPDRGETPSVPVFLQRGGRPVRVSASSRIKYVELEDLRVREHRIVFRPSEGGAWEIGGEMVTPNRGRVLVLGADGSVRFE